MTPDRKSGSSPILLAALAAFCTYFCMYAYRKPFSAGTFADDVMFGIGMKSVLVIAQGAGYMISKFMGIKIISEMRPNRRATWLVGLIVTAELALVGFALAPMSWKPLMLFLNGIPLGLVFGLVLGFLEGRRQTEFLSAMLCASFISASGVVKSIGVWTTQGLGVDEYWMPMIVGLMFFPLFLVSVWGMTKIPAPTEEDVRARAERQPMTPESRRAFFSAFWPGLIVLVLIYVFLTIIRTIRDDFAVELWRDMGGNRPAVFGQTELIVAILAVSFSAVFVWVKSHELALRFTLLSMVVSFLLVSVVTVSHVFGLVTPFVFMILVGVGLYIPYVAFHTTLFERIIAASNRPCNVGFLMYVADALGYLGYGLVLVFRESNPSVPKLLPFFHALLIVLAIVSIIFTIFAMSYFRTIQQRPAKEMAKN